MALGEGRRHGVWTWAIIAGAPLAAPVGAAEAPVVEVVAAEPEFLEFLAEEAGVDEDMSDALMSGDLDRALERSAQRRKVNDDGKDK